MGRDAAWVVGEVADVVVTRSLHFAAACVTNAICGSKHTCCSPPGGALGKLCYEGVIDCP